MKSYGFLVSLATFTSLVLMNLASRRISRTAALCFAIGLILFRTSTAEELISTRTGDSNNRVDIIFLGDGYQEHELNLYEQHIDGLLDHMFAERPFDRYREYFNIHRINVVSNDSGADVPPEGVVVDTALGSKYYFDGVNDRVLYMDQVLADTVLMRSIPFEQIFVPEMQFVSVNAERLGGGGGTYAVFAGANEDAYEIAVHEIAHAFSNLTDEYFFPGVYTGEEPPFANATTSAEGEKWSHWIGYQEPGIGAIGVYEGGMYHQQGVYRPSIDSKMRTLGKPFDAVSREALVLDIYKHVDPIDSASDAAEIDQTQRVSIETIDPSVVDLSWFVDGELLEGVSDETLELSQLTDMGFAPGTYDISVVAQDNTDWVRIRQDELRQEIVWENVQLVVDSVEVDIDSLTDAVIANSSDLTFDLNNDGIVDQLDRITWVETNETFFGDADLDGSVGFVDFLALSRNFGMSEATWSQGNFTIDKDVGFQDFLLLSGNFGLEHTSPSGEAVSVPEPAGQLGTLLLLVGSAVHFSRKKAKE